LEPSLSFRSARTAAMQTADVHGKWFEANYRGKMFTYNVTAVTIPVVASGVVSVFTLYNPPNPA
jgi:hypothetical protein